MEILQQLYKDSNITLAELSKKCGISVSTVHRYVKGNVKDVNKIYYDTITKALSDIQQIVDVKEAINTDALREKMLQNGITPIHTQETHKPHRGDIYYIKNTYAAGCEQFGSRPGLIVSGSKINDVLGTVTIVYLTGQPKHPMPTHITIKTSRDSTVLCEQLFTISKERLLNYMGHVSDSEMEYIDRGIMLGLGLHHKQVNITESHDYLRLQVENRMLKEFNETLLNVAMK